MPAMPVVHRPPAASPRDLYTDRSPITTRDWPNIPRSREWLLASQGVEDFERRATTLGRTAFHVTLEVDRAMLAGEVNRPLRDALVAAEQGVLAHMPVRV